MGDTFFTKNLILQPTTLNSKYGLQTDGSNLYFNNKIVDTGGAIPSLQQVTQSGNFTGDTILFTNPGDAIICQGTSNLVGPVEMHSGLDVTGNVVFHSNLLVQGEATFIENSTTHERFLEVARDSPVDVYKGLIIDDPVANVAIVYNGNTSVEIGYTEFNPTHGSSSDFQIDTSKSIDFKVHGNVLVHNTINFESNVILNASSNSISIGVGAGQQQLAENGISIGRYAASSGQNEGCISIGHATNANSTPESYTIAIGELAGWDSQNSFNIAIGYEAGRYNQGNGTSTENGHDCIAIGRSAGQNDQGRNSIALGFQSGMTNQYDHGISIGSYSGETDQGKDGIAIGFEAGKTGQVENSIAIGKGAGKSNLNTNAIAIGSNAGSLSTGVNSISIGYKSGTLSSGTNSIGIGSESWADNNNSIVLDASGSQLKSTQPGFFVKPIRNVSDSGGLLYYSSNNEIIESPLLQISSSSFDINTDVTISGDLTINGTLAHNTKVLNITSGSVNYINYSTPQRYLEVIDTNTTLSQKYVVKWDLFYSQAKIEQYIPRVLSPSENNLSNNYVRIKCPSIQNFHPEKYAVTATCYFKDAPGSFGYQYDITATGATMYTGYEPYNNWIECILNSGQEWNIGTVYICFELIKIA